MMDSPWFEEWQDHQREIADELEAVAEQEAPRVRWLQAVLAHLGRCEYVGPGQAGEYPVQADAVCDGCNQPVSVGHLLQASTQPVMSSDGRITRLPCGDWRCSLWLLCPTCFGLLAEGRLDRLLWRLAAGNDRTAAN
jgi:hypothetical protein